MTDEESIIVHDADFDDGPVTEGPPKSIGELYERLIIRDVARDEADRKRQDAEERWREEHDKKANARNADLFSLLESDRAENRREHEEFREDIHALKTTGVPRENSKIIKRAAERVVQLVAAIALCAMLVVVFQGAELAFCIWAFDKSPVVHAEPKR